MRPLAAFTIASALLVTSALLPTPASADHDNTCHPPLGGNSIVAVNGGGNTPHGQDGARFTITVLTSFGRDGATIARGTAVVKDGDTTAVFAVDPYGAVAECSGDAGVLTLQVTLYDPKSGARALLTIASTSGAKVGALAPADAILILPSGEVLSFFDALLVLPEVEGPPEPR